MRILVSNDDGIFATGINILAQALSEIANVTVVAPDRDCSAASHSLTLHRPLRVKYQENGYIAVEGTPTDSVHLAITNLLDEPPDMVVAGINHGANLGDDTLYSGTVAAAMEGRILGVPAIALSLAGEEQVNHFATAAHVAKNLVVRLQKEPLPSDTLLNVNVPDVSVAELQGIEVTRLGVRHNAEAISEQKDPRGKTIYWVGPAGPEQDAGLGTDFYAIRHNSVSVTPLQLDLTRYNVFDKLAAWTHGIKL